MVPLLKNMYFIISPSGPSHVVPDGTLVTLNTFFPVAASHTEAKLLAQRYAGRAPWKSGLFMSCT